MDKLTGKKILWLAPISFSKHSDMKVHPAPWIDGLAKLLLEEGINLTILNYTSKLANGQVKKIKDGGITYIFIGTPGQKIDFLTFYLLRIYIVNKYLKKIKEQFDLIHIHGTEHQYETMTLNLDKPTVISIQGIMSEYIKILPKKLIKQQLLWRLSAFYEKNFTTKHSNFMCRTHWDNNFINSNVKEPNIFNIWEVIRDDFFNDNNSFNSKKIIFVGGKNPIKGLKELLIAFDQDLFNEGFFIEILGNCNQSDLQKIIYENELSPTITRSVNLKGMLSSQEMISCFKNCFCLVHPTYIDNSPNSICEAQVSGLPVIATNVGGVASLIENNKDGILISRDCQLLSNKILELNKNQDLWLKISKNSISKARKRHNKNTIKINTSNAYLKILG